MGVGLNPRYSRQLTIITSYTHSKDTLLQRRETHISASIVISLYSRGEKLYLTVDKRNKKKRNRCLCWGVFLSIIAAAVIVGILAAGKTETKLKISFSLHTFYLQLV